MRQLFAWSVLFMIIGTSYAQKKTYHNDFTVSTPYRPIKKKDARFYRKVQPQAEGLFVQQYDKSTGKLAMEGITMAQTPDEENPMPGRDQVKHGTWTYYHPNGIKALTITYQEGVPVDTAYQWHSNGLKDRIGVFGPMKPLVYQPDFQILQAWDRIGHPLVTDGTGEITWANSMYPNPESLLDTWPTWSGKVAKGRNTGAWKKMGSSTNVLAEMNYKEGKLDGPYKGYRADGSLFSQGQYKEDQLEGYWEYLGYDDIPYHVDTFEVEEPKNDSLVIETEVEPSPLNMLEVVNAIGYPEFARDKNIQGQAIVRILVNEKGSPSRIHVVEDVHPVLITQVLQHIKSLKFSPAMINGESIPFWVNIPFNFRLIY
ncbi:MAG: TonB family protein [Bacteroidota bacterium]